MASAEETRYGVVCRRALVCLLVKLASSAVRVAMTPTIKLLIKFFS
jgi:hypothetical protein